jgi:hypothetical protein
MVTTLMGKDLAFVQSIKSQDSNSGINQRSYGKVIGTNPGAGLSTHFRPSDGITGL